MSLMSGASRRPTVETWSTAGIDRTGCEYRAGEGRRRTEVHACRQPDRRRCDARHRHQWFQPHRRRIAGGGDVVGRSVLTHARSACAPGTLTRAHAPDDSPFRNRHRADGLAELRATQQHHNLQSRRCWLSPLSALPGCRGVVDSAGRSRTRRYCRVVNAQAACQAARASAVVGSKSALVRRNRSCRSCPQLIGGRAAPEPVAAVDLVDHEAGREHERVRHGRAWCGSVYSSISSVRCTSRSPSDRNVHQAPVAIFILFVSCRSLGRTVTSVGERDRHELLQLEQLLVVLALARAVLAAAELQHQRVVALQLGQLVLGACRRRAVRSRAARLRRSVPCS